MPLDKLLGFTKDVGDLTDKPNGTMSATQVKAQFDAAPNELRLAFNQLIDDLGSVVDGDSGADNIGATGIAGITGNTLQALLESLKTLVDSKTSNNGNHAGTWQNLNPADFDVGQQAVQIESHVNDNVRHITAEERTSWNGNAKKVQPAWIPATLTNGWLNSGGVQSAPAYFKDEMGFVHIKGAIKNGAAGNIFTLPTGYRPLEQLGFGVKAFNGTSLVMNEITITSSGNVNISSTGLGNASLSLDDIRLFRAEQ